MFEFAMLSYIPGPCRPMDFGMLNGRSIANKGALVQDLIISGELDILAVSETWIQSDAPDPILHGCVPAGRVVVSVSTSRSRDGLETYFSNVSVSSRSRGNVGRSWSRSRLGLKTKCLGLVSVSCLKVSFTSKFSRVFFHINN